MTILEDIKTHPTDFNIDFYLRDFASEILFSVFFIEENRQQIESTINGIKPQEYAPMAIMNMLRKASEDYLKKDSGFDSEPDNQT